MYVRPNFKHKIQLKRAIAAGETVTVFQPGPFGKDPTTYTGDFSVEGPHWPKAHTWYARVRVHEGVVKKVLS